MENTNREQRNTEQTYEAKGSQNSYVETALLYASGMVTGIVGHSVGVVLEVVGNCVLRKTLPSVPGPVVGILTKVLHESVEVMISTGSLVELIKGKESIVGSLVKAFEPVYEKPGMFVFAAVGSVLAESFLAYSCSGNFRGCGHSHDNSHSHGPKEIVSQSLASVIGGAISIVTYEWLMGDSSSDNVEL